MSAAARCADCGYDDKEILGRDRHGDIFCPDCKAGRDELDAHAQAVYDEENQSLDAYLPLGAP